MVIDILDAARSKAPGTGPVYVIVNELREPVDLRRMIATHHVCSHFGVPGYELTQTWDKRVVYSLPGEFIRSLYLRWKSVPFVHHTVWDYSSDHDKEELMDALDYVWYKTPESRGL